MAAHWIMPAAAAPLGAARLTACIPAPSAASIMEATQGDFPRAAGRASAAVPMAEGSLVGRGMVGGAMVEAEEVTDEDDARDIFKSIRGVCNDARNEE